MNIHPMIEATQKLNVAIVATCDPTERAEIGNIRDRLAAQLRKRGVFIGTEPAPKAANGKTSAYAAGYPNDTTRKRLGESMPTMDDEDLLQDLNRLCKEQQETIATLTTQRDSLIAALKDTLSPLQDAQNQLHHVAAAAAFINAREIIRHVEPNFARGVS